MRGLLLVAHGSRDPRSGAAIHHLAGRIAAQLPDVVVRAAFLELTHPSIAEALAELAEQVEAIVVMPLVLTSGFHETTDLPDQIARAQADGGLPPVDLVDGFATDPLVGAALRDQLHAAGVTGPGWGIVLAAAGSSRAQAREQVFARCEEVAGRVEVGFLSGPGPSVSDAIGALRSGSPQVGGSDSDPATKVAIATYLMAPGHFTDQLDQVDADARTRPLAESDRFVEAILSRFATYADAMPQRRSQAERSGSATAPRRPRP